MVEKAQCYVVFLNDLCSSSSSETKVSVNSEHIFCRVMLAVMSRFLTKERIALFTYFAALFAFRFVNICSAYRIIAAVALSFQHLKSIHQCFCVKNLQGSIKFQNLFTSQAIQPPGKFVLPAG